jgi:hypothetical protein
LVNGSIERYRQGQPVLPEWTITPRNCSLV